MIFSREQVVEEVRSWKTTPYHKGGRIKCAGVDCSTILLEVFMTAGFVSPEDAQRLEELIPRSQDWFCHTGEEKYLKLVMRHAVQVLHNISYPTLAAKPGNIAIVHHSPDGKRFNHGGVVTAWPMLVHAVAPRVEEVDATKHWMWNYREVVIFDPWEKLAQQSGEQPTYMEQWT